MHINALNIPLQELFQQLKEILASEVGSDVSIEVITSSIVDTKKIRTFAAMSGCKTDIREIDKDYLIHIHGYPCCV